MTANECHFKANDTSLRDDRFGANGIILDNIDEPSALTKVIGAVAKTGSERKGKALAIYIPSEFVAANALCEAKKREKEK